MKSFFSALLMMGFLPMLAQNSAPQISVTDATYTFSFGILTVDYDLTDGENDTCTVAVMLSSDGGKTYSFPVSSLKDGEIGEGIVPGPGKQLALVNPVFFFDSLTRVKVIAWDSATPDLGSWVSQIDSVRLREELSFIAQPRNPFSHPAHLSAVRDSLKSYFEAVGLEASIQQVPTSGITGGNAIGRHPGLIDADTRVVIDGHFDAVPNGPGANDNGIATAALMEAARIISQGYFRNSIDIVGFDLEEYGLIGSERYVSQLPPEVTVAAVLNMEMVGYFTEKPYTQQLPTGFNLLFPQVYQVAEADSFKGNFLANVGNTASLSLQQTFDSLVAIYAPDLVVYSLTLPGTGTIAPDFRRSDHAPFWDAGIPALMLTAGADFRDSAYHSVSDTLGRISFSKSAEVFSGVLATALHLAGPLNAGSDTAVVVLDLSGDAILPLLPDQAVLMYPNPGSEYLMLEASFLPTRVRILSASGQLILEDVSGEKTLSIQTSDWPAGVYLMSVEKADGIWQKQWVKQ